ncbi:uncharacterized protein [Drosophila suzukii]|uniref:Uncharacterized protein n=1 Tax=Drosophila suzukii TaxID=28584 RepID=A0ABM4TQU9_DROSZ
MRHDLNLTPVPSFRNWNSNTTDRMIKCSFCLILFITNEFLLISGNKNERSINTKSDFGLTHIDNSQKTIYAAKIPIALFKELMPERNRVKRMIFSGRISYDHKGNPVIRNKARTKDNWFWNVF